jgi:hypothetical protein
MTRHPAFSFRRLLAALFWLALLVPASPVLADGKYYAREAKVGPGIPYQRAMIAFNGEREILVVQSRYENRGEQPLARNRLDRPAADRSKGGHDGAVSG